MIEYVNKVDVRLIQHNMSDEMVAMSAWVSNDLDSEERFETEGRPDRLINFLWRNRHTSPFEHGNLTVKVDGPLFVVREWHRHRTQSYNEVSGRYTVMKPRFYMSDATRVQAGPMGDYYFVPGTPEMTAVYRQTQQKADEMLWDLYQQRLEIGMAKEQAREILPLNLMTQWYATANPLNWMRFLTLRNERHALKEIRDAAVQVEEIFAEAMPLTHAAFRQDEHMVSIDLTQSREKIKDQVEDILRSINMESLDAQLDSIS